MERVPVKARFKALYDDANVYILSEGDLADDVSPKSFSHDGPVWIDECVDMIVAPGDNRDVRYHFIYGVDKESRYDDATGLIKDPLDPGYGKADVTWNGKGWKFANRRSGDRWFSMLTIPFSMLGRGKPNPGEMWCFNLGREWNGWTGDPSKFVDALWSPDVETGSFKSLAAMGELTFE